MRNDSLVRCLKLRALLLQGSMTLESLATTFGVSTRTIRRDIKALQAAGESVHYLPTHLHVSACVCWALEVDGDSIPAGDIFKCPVHVTREFMRGPSGMAS